MVDAGSSVESAIVEGRKRLLLFVAAGGSAVPTSRLTPTIRLALGSSGPRDGRSVWLKRLWRGAVIAIVPIALLVLTAAVGDREEGPGWITWVWCGALCGINAIYLVGGPILWNALITAGIAIDRAGMSAEDSTDVSKWIRGHYGTLRVQALCVALGAAAGMALLWFIDWASNDAFTLGIGEYSAMAWTAGLSVNGLWILWWIAGLIPVLGRQETLHLDWHNPARTPAVVFLNRALWKTGGAISLGMVLLAIAVQGQPSPFSSWSATPTPWVAAVIAEYVAFVIVACVFVRDGIWAQWQVFRLVRHQIDRWRQPIDRELAALFAVYPSPGRDNDKVLYYAELDRHFDGLRTVDLKLGWALAWATSIFGAAASVIASTVSITPN